jgi:hypothetical protein
MTCSDYGQTYTFNTLNSIECLAPSCSEEEFMALSKAGVAEVGDFDGLNCTFRPFSGLETPSTAGTETWVIVLLTAACCTILLLN